MIAPPWGWAYSDYEDTHICSSCGKGSMHDPGCRTAALESTVEAMGKALEEALELLHNEPTAAMAYKAMAEASPGWHAALASWRELT